MYKAVREHFPNYYDCYAFLGLQPSKVRGQRRYASAEDVITGIRRRCDLGLGTRVVDLVFGPKRTRDNPLLKSAVHFFWEMVNGAELCEYPSRKEASEEQPLLNCNFETVAGEAPETWSEVIICVELAFMQLGAMR